MGGLLFYPHYVTSSLHLKSQIVVISLLPPHHLLDPISKHLTVGLRFQRLWPFEPFRNLSQAPFEAWHVYGDLWSEWLHTSMDWFKGTSQPGHGRDTNSLWTESELKKPPSSIFSWQKNMFNSDARFEPLRLTSFPSCPHNLQPQNHVPGSPTLAVCRSWLDFNSRPCCLGSYWSLLNRNCRSNVIWPSFRILPCFHVFGYPPVT